MYLSDFSMKKAVVQDVYVQNNRNVFLTYASTWLMSPGIDSDRLDEITKMFATEQQLSSPQGTKGDTK